MCLCRSHVLRRMHFNPQPPRRTAAIACSSSCAFSVSLFQSSAAPKDGCDEGFKRFRVVVCNFNPQPPRRTAAMVGIPDIDFSVHAISILSRPEGRLRSASCLRSSTRLGFQSSAAPKDGCDATATPTSRRTGHFNPQPPRRTAAIVGGRRTRRRLSVISILSRPEGRLRSHHAAGFAASLRISILSRPEGRLRWQPRQRDDQGSDISILSRPEGRLRSRRQGRGLRWSTFQSSAAPKDGCDHAHGGGFLGDDISILSRPEGRLRSYHTIGSGTYTTISILSRPEGRLRSLLQRARRGGVHHFNPQPPRRTAAIGRRLQKSGGMGYFNPQPPRRTAAIC